MSKIRVVYQSRPPAFPATDQHPQAVRYKVGPYWVDALEGAPTLQEVEAVLNPPPPPPKTALARLQELGINPDELKTELAKT